MTTRRRSKYSIQSDVSGLRSIDELSKGKIKGKIPSGTESTQATAISKRQVPDMAMISETGLELKFEEHTSSNQKLLLEHVEESDEARMNLKDDIKSEIRLITEKMDKINEANLDIPRLSTPIYHIRSPVKPKEEITNTFITDLSHQDNKKVLIKEEPQFKEWPTFTGEGEYDHTSFIKKINTFQEDYAIPDELITAILHSLFEKSAK
ncbi:hypothetical protein O181_059758 [Austropuccinia psidii MF-1]|uniref:Uncharacterized protein n=1 Tax=Austropuccinia psidii MF-1 TaxID=1389203 RepID=A0A9Q3HWT8_9BASI|nr:hypothetical protein [Austropuccinia psidii MF-1]